MSDEPFDYGKTKPDGQHERYPVAEKPEYVQPIRNQYKHTKCGAVTRCGDAIARTYASNPHYYTHTFCVSCKTHPPLSEFTWLPDGLPMNEIGGPAGADWRDLETVPPPEWQIRINRVELWAKQANDALALLKSVSQPGIEQDSVTQAVTMVAAARQFITDRIKQDEQL